MVATRLSSNARKLKINSLTRNQHSLITDIVCFFLNFPSKKGSLPAINTTQTKPERQRFLPIRSHFKVKLKKYGTKICTKN